VCAACAITAASAATGVRSWLQNHHFGWLTPRRMRVLTIAAIFAATLVSTVGFSGSTPSAKGGQAGSAFHHDASRARAR